MSGSDESKGRPGTDRGAKAKAARAALLKRRLNKTSGESGPSAGAAQRTSIPKRPPDAPALASSAQARLYFLHQLHPNSAAYHMNAALQLHGVIDHQALEEAIRGLVERHDSLRTGFSMENGQLWLNPLNATDVELRVERLTGVVGDGLSELNNALVERVRRPFDLHQGPVFRAELLQSHEQAHVLLLTMHHIVADEWSLNIMLTELAAAYNNAVNELGAKPTEPVIDYADYAAWQQNRLADVVARDLPYWVEQLGEGFSAPRLPEQLPAVSKNAPPINCATGQLLHLQSDAGLGRAIQNLASETKNTPFNVIMGVFGVLLSRYTGESEIAFATPSANRDRPELETVVGLFLNSVIINDSIDDSLTFREHLQRVQRVAQDAYAHQTVPFEDIVSALHPNREADRNPLFQVMLVEETASGGRPDLTGLRVQRLQLDTGFAKLDMSCFVRFIDDDIYLAVEFDTRRFAAPVMKHLLRSFQTLSVQCATYPDRVLRELPILDDDQVGEIMGQGTGPAYDDLDSGQLITQRILQHAGSDLAVMSAAADASSTQGPASAQAFEHLSYSELIQASHAFARQLQIAGVKRGDYLPILAQPGPLMMVGLLSAWWIGAAYVPLNPDEPRSRLEQILHDLHQAGCCSPVTLYHDLPEQHAWIKAQGRQISVGAAEECIWEPEPLSFDDIAYVIYTSGSTGTPKGVPITHGNLAASTAARFKAYTCSPQRYLLLSSFSFDSSVAGIWWTLSAGGTLVTASAEQRQDPREIAQLLRECRISHTLMLPDLYRLTLSAITQSDGKNTPDGLEMVIVAGEACPPDLPAQHFSTLTDVALVNEYGPTEACVWATLHHCTRADTGRITIPIGKPVPGMQAIVLDQGQQLLPPGALGELILSGPQLSTGYLGDPDLTSKRFLASDLVQGGRYYRTGDRVWLDEEGQLQFSGRTDRQLKLRGQRLEPAGLEAVIQRESGVVEAHVGLTGNRPNRPIELCAWLRVNERFDLDRLRNVLSVELPRWMMPASFVVLERFPRTVNGKLDSKRLPQPEPAESHESNARHLLATETERALAKIWEDLLGVPVEHSNADFFALGGHSLSGVAMMMAVELQLGVSLPLATLFESSILAHLAGKIDLKDDDVWPDGLSPIHLPSNQTATEPKAALFCIHNGARLMAEHLGEDQPVYLLFEPLEQVPETLRSIEGIAQRYLTAMRAVQPQGPYHLVGFSVGCQIAVEIAHRLGGEGESVAFLALAEPPLTDAALFYRLQARLKQEELRAVRGIPGRARWFFSEARKSVDLRLRRRRFRQQIDEHQRQGTVPDPELIKWRQASQYAALYTAYSQRPWPGDTVIFLPATERVNEAEISRYWSGMFTGRLRVLLVHNAKTHQDLIDEASGAAIAEEVGRLMSGEWTKGSGESAAF